MRSRLLVLTLFGMALLFTVAVAEGVIRLTHRYSPRIQWYPGETPGPVTVQRHFMLDSVLGWRGQPHDTFHLAEAFVHLNAQGWRGDDLPASCDQRRVILTGDSFAFGYGLEDSATIGAQLGVALGLPVTAMAAPGYAVAQMLQVVRYHARAACPMAVVVAFIDDDFTRSLTGIRQGDFTPKPRYVLEADTLRLLTMAERPTMLDRLTRPLHLRRLYDRFVEEQGYRYGRGPWFQVNAAMIRAMAHDAGAPVLFVRLPTRGAERSFPALARFMAGEHLDYLDLGDSTRSGLFLGDGHFNHAGAAWAAGAMAARLRAQNTR